MSELKLVTGEEAELLLELGDFPVAHKFVQPDAKEAEQTFPLRVGMGKRTHLVGLIDPPPWQALTPIYPWVVCNEPEEHLDRVAKKISSLIPPDARILGLSDKDRTLLQRISQLKSIPLDDIDVFSHPMLDEQVNPGVEAVQAAISGLMNNEETRAPAAKPYDLVVARHILEHTSNTRAFLAWLVEAIGDDGLAIIEVPDNEKAFETGQHTVIWEEHSLYFTEFTLNTLLEENGLEVITMNRYPMALEDILVVIVGKIEDGNASSHYDIHPFQPLKIQMESLLPKQFALLFESNTLLIQAKLHTYREQYGRIAILGAGHLGAAFVNFYEVGDLIDAVIDDDPNKQGLLLPGCQLPVTSSGALNRGEFGLCLLTCNPWNNDKVAARNQGFLDAGGTFLSVFELENWL